ncbi:hypothetical protein SUGI_0136920 [Cryptomeria japonica]|uniref:GDSL lipase n=1 Tax=Cryptomeria japonica TaxID=3369 RepID=UPI002408CEB2|nr:GDSL lipase [Cryptomeria japonica]GLJ10869.1 hypothetical protein SUGI_0136920 [Cryptomeria japonica]
MDIKFTAILCFCVVFVLQSGTFAAGIEKDGVGLFIFGDSTVDPGNNNYISTVPQFRADHPPYGNNGFFDSPTGRFSEGRVIVDFIAEYAKLPLIPPFFQPEADFSNGANFASGGAGILLETNEGFVVDLQKQLDQFEEVQNKLVEELGSVEAQKMFSEAVYFFSIGSNDYLGGYLGNPKMQELHPPEEYVGMVVTNVTKAIQILYSKGARKFGHLGLSPLGCLPIMRAIASDPNGGCLGVGSVLARSHNSALSTAFRALASALPGLTIADSNFFDFLNDRLEKPSEYGFKEGVKACCGSGPYGGIFSCGGQREEKEYEVCEDPKNYVWWDAYHVTESIHKQFAEAMWAGSDAVIQPTNLRELFQTRLDSSHAALRDEL